MAALSVSPIRNNKRGPINKKIWNRNRNKIKRIYFKNKIKTLTNNVLKKNLNITRSLTKRESRPKSKQPQVKKRQGSLPTRANKIRYECIQNCEYEKINKLEENSQNNGWLHPFTGLTRNVPTTKIKVDNREITCTVDTGATRVMITSELAKEIWGRNYRTNLSKYPANRAVNDAQGNTVTVEGFKQCKLELGSSLSVSYPIVIYTASHVEMLLGYSFMVDYNLVIYCGKGLGTEPKPEIIKRINVEEYLECETLEEEMIPAKATKLIKVKINFPGDWTQAEKLAAIGSPIIIHSENIEKIPVSNLTCPYIYNILNIDSTATVIIDNTDFCEPKFLKRKEIIAHAEFVQEEVSQEKVNRILEDDIYSLNNVSIGELKLEEEKSPERFEYISKINIKSEEPGTEEFCKDLLEKTEPFWSKHPFDLGKFDKKARMTMHNTNPIRDKYRPVNPLKEKQAADIVAQLEKHNIIKRGNSPYCSQPVWVWKKPRDKSGKDAIAGEADLTAPRALRLALDYRKINKQISSVCNFPNPSIREILFKLKRARYVSIIDLTNSYWNVELSESTKPILAFQTAEAQFLWNRLPQGTAPSMSIMAEAVQDTIQTGGISSICTCYVDNLLIMSESLEEHKQDLRKTVDTFISRGWKANPGKSHLFVNTSCRLFGFAINLKEATIGPDPQKVAAILELPAPTNQKTARSLCGSINYYSDLIPDLAPLMRPIHEVTKDDKFDWTQECEENFCEIKKKLAKLPVIHMPDFNKPMHLFTDAAMSQYLGYHISQYNENLKKFVPVAWGSHKFNKNEQSMSQPEAELFAIVYAVINESLLLGFSKIICHTDCRSLTYLFRFSKICSKLNRWQLLLNSFNIDIYFEPSTSIGIIMADMLSRRPEQRPTNRRPKLHEIEELPKIKWKQKTTLTFQQAREEITKEFKNLPPISQEAIKQIQETTQITISPEDLQCNKSLLNQETNSNMIEDHTKNTYNHKFVYTPEDMDFKKDISPTGRLINLVLQEAPGLSLQALRYHLHEDPVFGPKMREMIKQSQTIPGYAMKNGILLKEVIDSTETTKYVICVPRSLSLELIGKFHYSVFGAHPDLKKLMINLKRRFFIKNMKNEINQIIKNCKICTLNKSFNTIKQPYGTKIAVTGPRQIYCMDICTVDTQAKDIDPNLPTSFLIFTDAWSLYTICVPINANATCREILEKFSRHIIQPFGPPKFGIVTDGGKNFSNRLSNIFSASLGLQQFRISSYNARANPAERVNRAILSGLRYAQQHHKLQPEVFKNLLNYIVLGWNTSSLSSIKFSPYELFLSTPYEPACLTSFVTVHEAEKADYGDFIEGLIKSQHIVENLVNDRYQKIRDKRYEEKAAKSKYSMYAPGTQVMIKKRIDQTKRIHKLRPRYLGPYKITREFQNNVEVIDWSRERKVKIIHKYKNEARNIPKYEKFLVGKDRIKPCSNLTYYYDEALARRFYQTFWDTIKDVQPVQTVERFVTPTENIKDQPNHRPSSLILPAKLGIKRLPMPHRERQHSNKSSDQIDKRQKRTTKKIKVKDKTYRNNKPLSHFSDQSDSSTPNEHQNKNSLNEQHHIVQNDNHSVNQSSQSTISQRHEIYPDSDNSNHTSSSDSSNDDHDNDDIYNRQTLDQNQSREDDSDIDQHSPHAPGYNDHHNIPNQQDDSATPIRHMSHRITPSGILKPPQETGARPKTKTGQKYTTKRDNTKYLSPWTTRHNATMVGFGNSGTVIIFPGEEGTPSQAQTSARQENEVPPFPLPGPSHSHLPTEARGQAERPTHPLPNQSYRGRNNPQPIQDKAKSISSKKSMKSARSRLDPAVREAIESQNTIFQDEEFDKLKEFYQQGGIEKDFENVTNQLNTNYQDIEKILTDNENDEI